MGTFRLSAFLIVVAASVALAAPPIMPIQPTLYGKRAGDGAPVSQFVVTNRRGFTAKFITLGATLTSLEVPDKSGKPIDVVLGFDDLAGYEQKNPYFGCVLGRVANRTAHGKFVLDGEKFELATNDGQHHLNGGKSGFDKANWEGEALPFGVRFRYQSRDGEEGYPGAVDVTVTYTVNDKNALKVEYRATADRPTPLNLANRYCFNLNGHGSGDVLKHELMIDAPQFTPADESGIPSGEFNTVVNTPYDFREAKPISLGITKLGGAPKGFDVNYMLSPSREATPLRAKLREPTTGRELLIFTSEPALQLDTCHKLDGKLPGKGGTAYKPYQGVCLQCQRFPDAMNHTEFPSVLLQPGQVYTQTTIYQFTQK